MEGFIKLTSRHTGGSLWINISHIVSFQDQIIITTRDIGCSTAVNETADDIRVLIQSSYKYDGMFSDFSDEDTTSKPE